MPRIIITPEDLIDCPPYLRAFYDEGKEAKKSGVRLWECPYKGIISLERAWQQGWNDAELEIVQSEHSREEFEQILREWYEFSRSKSEKEKRKRRVH